MARSRKPWIDADFEHGDERSWRRTEVVGKLLSRSGVAGRLVIALVIIALLAIVVLRVT